VSKIGAKRVCAPRERRNGPLRAVQLLVFFLFLIITSRTPQSLDREETADGFPSNPLTKGNNTVLT
jgi:hypothetical protein